MQEKKTQTRLAKTRFLTQLKHCLQKSESLSHPFSMRERVIVFLVFSFAHCIANIKGENDE